MDLTSITIRPNQNIREAMEAINHRDGASCLVVDKDGRLKGTVSDGDVRRGLLRGETLDSPVENILYTDPTVAKIDTPDDELLLMMQAKGIRDIPLIDEQGTLVVVRTLRELRDELNRSGDGPPLPFLSMGMSADFEIALEEGATHLRLGTVLTGPRPGQHKGI